MLASWFTDPHYDNVPCLSISVKKSCLPNATFRRRRITRDDGTWMAHGMRNTVELSRWARLRGSLHHMGQPPCPTSLRHFAAATSVSSSEGSAPTGQDETTDAAQAGDAQGP